MARKRRTSRRSYLSAIAAGSAVLAGCTGGGDGGSGGESGGSDGSDGESGGSDGATTGESGGTTQGGSDDLTEVTFATTETGSAGVLTTIIQDRGLDEKHGIKVTVQAAAPAKAMQLLKNNAVETSIFSPQSAAVANTEGSDIRLFGPVLSNHNSLVTTPDSDIEGWEDLVGERVGILSPPSSMWNQTNLMLAEMGHSMEDFDFRKGSPGAIHSFNVRGDVAAHIHFIPVTLKTVTAGEMREVMFLPDKFEELWGHNIQLVPIGAHQSWLDENAETAKNLRAALIDAQKLFTESTEETIRQYQETLGISGDEQIQAAVERVPATYPAAWGDTQREGLTSQLERSKEYGIIPEDAPTDIVADI